MIERTIYECETCGKVCSNKKDCIAHELIEKYWLYKRVTGTNIVFWDADGKRINNEEDAIKNFIKVYAVRVEGENMFDWLEEAGEQLGFFAPWNESPYLSRRLCATYVYNADIDEWVNAENELMERKEAVASWENFIEKLK